MNVKKKNKGRECVEMSSSISVLVHGERKIKE
jgi:hypothetical protein